MMACLHLYSEVKYDVRDNAVELLEINHIAIVF